MSSSAGGRAEGSGKGGLGPPAGKGKGVEGIPIGPEVRSFSGVRTCLIFGTIAVAWVVFITVLFMLPAASPITWSNFNYTVFAVLVVIGFAGIYWLVSARKWFKGPKVQGSAEELAAIERELSV